MSDIAVKVENLSKLYRIGAKQEQYSTLRSALISGVKGLIRRRSAEESDKNTIWALKDVSFEIKQGEVIGIIGRNGAGKSTLLKVLSHITEPTIGRVSLYGRVGSLLEVGTGFHPELTGRDNIYLNGAILGMKRAEIERKFDEIVDFADIEKFLDTPVKRFSSGMYVRLAFAVAAHLEPEILVVDEVLAVGDSEFQKKCLGKMGDVAREGRTVLFVSHNMQAIQAFCTRAIQIAKGRIVDSGDTQSIISNYFSSYSENNSGEMSWSYNSAPGDVDFKLLSIRVQVETSNSSGIYQSHDDLIFEMEFILNRMLKPLCVGFDLMTPEGLVVFRSFQTDLSEEEWLSPKIGKNVWQCTLPGGMLNGGTYFLCPRIGIYNQYWIVNLDSVVKFNIILDHGVSPLWNVYNDNNRPGILAPIFAWHAVHQEE